MVDLPEKRQRIARLTPLDDVLREVRGRVGAVPSCDVELGAALGATLAQDIAATERRPAAPLALIDGWALRAEATADAAAYAPAALPLAVEIAAGEALPAGADAVAPPDIVTRHGEAYAALEPINAGDGVLMPGTDAGAGEVLRRAGERLRASDLAAMRAFGISRADVRRPRIRLVRARDDGAILGAIAAWLGHAIAADGGEPVDATTGTGATAAADAIVSIGGTGLAPRDRAALDLAGRGTLVAHGVALSPGETAAFGIAGRRPVLLVPGRLDAAAAVWLLIGRAMLARLRGGIADEPGSAYVLTAKVPSTVGLTEFVPVRRRDDGVEPLATKYLPIATLAHADGWIVIPAASEGLPPGARVDVRPLP
jgi:molybdopterin molybdotransferase